MNSRAIVSISEHASAFLLDVASGDSDAGDSKCQAIRISVLSVDNAGMKVIQIADFAITSVGLWGKNG